jgi:hypothetical protein
MSAGTGGIGRSILAVAFGTVMAVIVLFGIGGLGMKVYPPSVAMDASNPEFKSMLKHVPLGALLFVLAATVAGTFAGAAVAARLAPHKPVLHAMVIAVMLLAANFAILVRMPHPWWFATVNVLALLPAAYAGALAARRS